MPEEVKKAVKYNPRPIGDSGLKHASGYITEEFLRELRGEKGARTFREMADNDPVIGAMLFAVTTLIRQSKWTVTAADDSPEGDAAKDFCEEVLFNDMSVSFSAVISEVCSMFTYGFAPMEITWKRRGGLGAKSPEQRSRYSDGKIGLRTIALRRQPSIQRWDIDPDDGTIIGLWQQPYTKPLVYIPIEKLLLFRTTEEANNPEGRSILRNAYRPWFFKKRIEEIEGVGVERDLAGLPLVRIPGEFFDPAADAITKATFKQWSEMVTRVRRDQQEGLVLPSDRDSSGNLLFDFELLSTGGSRTFDTTAIIDRYDRRIATTVLADFIFLGQQSVGSFALSSDKTALFATAIGAFVGSIVDVFNRHLLPRLWELNGLDFEIMPKLACGDFEKQALTEVADFVQKITASGATLFPDRELENHLRDLAGFPQAPEDSGDMPGSQYSPGNDGDGYPAVEQVAGQQDDPPVEKSAPTPVIINNVVTPEPVEMEKRFIYDDKGLLIGMKEVRGDAQ